MTFLSSQSSPSVPYLTEKSKIKMYSLNNILNYFFLQLHMTGWCDKKRESPQTITILQSGYHIFTFFVGFNCANADLKETLISYWNMVEDMALLASKIKSFQPVFCNQSLPISNILLRH